MSLRRRLSADVVTVHQRWRLDQGLDPMSAFAKLRLGLSGLLNPHPLVWVPRGELQYDFQIRADSSDEYVFQQIFRDREYDIEFPSPQTIVDAGANIGLAAILFASRFPDALIIAFEPDADNFRVLQRNASPYPNLRCVQAGIWHRDAVLERVPDAAKPWAYRFQETSRPEGVPSISLDQVAEMFPTGCIDLLKMDIEGAEKDVMSPEADWLSSVVTVLVETHDRMVDGCEASVVSSLPETLFERSSQGENHVFIRRDKLNSGSIKS